MDICTTYLRINCIFAPAQYWVLYLLTFPRFSRECQLGMGLVGSCVRKTITNFILKNK